MLELKLVGFSRIYKLQDGQSLLEVILAIAIFGLLVSSLISLVVGSFRSLEQGGEQTQAEAIAEEGIEAVRAIRDRAWNLNTYGQSGVEITGGEWVFSGEGTTDTIGQFTRTISFEDVCRDSMDDITSCPGNYTDVQSKKISVVITWTTGTGAINSVQKIAYLTNWDSREWVEDLSADFSDGTFTNTVEDGVLGDGDGAIILLAL